MAEQYLMSMDVGTQSAKVIIFDIKGNIICQGVEPLKTIEVPGPALAIHPGDDIWEAIQIALDKVMKAFVGKGLDASNIKAIGLCVIRCCRTVLKSDHTLAYPVIGWMDKRLNYPYKWEEAFGDDVKYVSTSSGYITFRLTGEFKDTCANYIGQWPMNDKTLDWSDNPEDWKKFNLTRDMVADLVKPGEVLAPLRNDLCDKYGLPRGIPVVATAHDKAVEALGAGSLDNGTILISLGTYIAALTSGKNYVENSVDYWPFQASIPNRYIYECWGVRLGMWSISWFRDNFGQAAVYDSDEKGLIVEEILNREAQKVPAGSDGLLTLHDFAAPPHAEFRKAAFLGLDSRHTRAHMYRSLLEGIGFTLKNHVDKMNKELNEPTKAIVVSGGGANSDLFMQVLADIFGVPARRNVMRGSAAVGCAINAGYAVGIFKDYDKAISDMVQVQDIFEPNMKNHELYNKLNEDVYKHIQEHLDPLFEKLHKIVD